ncbi:DMT family transporter [Streptacidiphilus jiangxiensis]|uniref:Threonine/homoserine efflux transporter RhtA n=1 Tax=Streptacidiphilus jiangxiensis TaxID=235985 RepID=A0A1H7YY60_STRJI|nr:DMT family transporter [Streptacidiphilus jiangxiensis]SEM50207.1 Threonine/homoserine efflux transporter RhtA [Streptacidiphilus jiangxiensis]
MRGFGLVGLSATGFGLMPVFAVHAYGDGLTVPTLLFLRFAIAAALFLPCAWWYARRRGGLRVTRGDLLRVALLGGVLYAAQSTLYFSAVRHISPALAALILYVYPALVACGAAAIGKERPTAAVVGSVVVTLCGVALALGRLGGGLSAVGIGEAVGAAVVYTVYILYGDRLGAGGLPPVALTGLVSLFAALSFLGYGAVRGQLSFGFREAGWVPVVCVALGSTVVAILCFFAGMALLGPTKASLGSMLEPVVSIVAAAALLPGSALTALQLLGAALVLVGASVGVLAQRRPAVRAVAGGGS